MLATGSLPKACHPERSTTASKASRRAKSKDLAPGRRHHNRLDKLKVLRLREPIRARSAQDDNMHRPGSAWIFLTLWGEELRLTMVPDEHLLARFFGPTKRERYVEMISNPKKRKKFLRELPHFKSLDPRYFVPVPPKKLFPNQISVILTTKGAPRTCWITSQDPHLGRELPLLEALQEVVGGQRGTFLTCIPGRLAYFEGEEMGDRWILERRD